MPPLTNSDKRDLKARAQRLEPVLKVGHAGATPAFVASLDDALKVHGLVKIKFVGCKEEKKSIAPALATQTHSELIMRVGNVAVYFREKTASAASE